MTFVIGRAGLHISLEDCQASRAGRKFVGPFRSSRTGEGTPDLRTTWEHVVRVQALTLPPVAVGQVMLSLAIGQKDQSGEMSSRYLADPTTAVY